MKKLKFILNKDVTKKECKWLQRDFKKDEKVVYYTGSTYNCISKEGFACSIDGMEPFFELPFTSLDVSHLGKAYGIFITERSFGSFIIYCKNLPVNRTKLLTEIQNPVKESPLDKVLKFTISKNGVLTETVFLKDIEPLF